MAETVAPSVRGRQRILVESALLGGSVVTAVLTGFTFGLLGEGMAELVGTIAGSVALPAPVATGPGAMGIVALVTVGLMLDVCHLSTGRPRPLSVGRQVPREWGRLLPLPVTAFLYGARLGAGPLTILSTWMWWAALIGAATVGIWEAVAVSVWFALWRNIVNGFVGRRLARGPRSNPAAIRSLRRRSWSSLTGVAVVLTVVTAVLAGCGLAGDPAVRPMLLDRADQAGTNATVTPSEAASPPPTSQARLEDFVTTPTTVVAPELDTSSESSELSQSSQSSGAEEAVVATPRTAQDPAGLAAFAPAALNGMAVIDDPGLDRFLTIDEAAAIQPDPSEEIALLETRGFRGGWIRAFRSPTSDVAVASVYEFADATEAEFYLQDGLITIGGYGGRFFDIADLPDVRGFEQDVVDDGEAVRTLGGAFQRDNRWFLLYVVGSPETVTPNVLISALRSWRGDLGV